MKKSKPSVNYQNTPKEGEQCSHCSMYIVHNQCTDVEGFIYPRGWCKLWYPREAKKE